MPGSSRVAAQLAASQEYSCLVSIFTFAVIKRLLEASGGCRIEKNQF
jgi:hypothetical protein